DRLHWTKPQGFTATSGHHLDRQAPIEIGRRGFPFVERYTVAGQKSVEESLVLRPVERAVDVVGAGAARPRVVVAGLEPGHRHVDRFPMDDRRDGIEEGERVFARHGPYRRGKGGRGERTSRDDDAVPCGGREGRALRPRPGRQRGGAEAPPAGARDGGGPAGAGESRWRSRATAPPAGTWLASPARITSEPSRRISSCRRPTALCSRSSERNEFEHTSSASPPVLWAAVVRLGRIS